MLFDGEPLSVGHPLKELGQMRFGFEGAYLVHDINPFNQSQTSLIRLAPSCQLPG